MQIIELRCPTERVGFFTSHLWSPVSSPPCKTHVLHSDGPTVQCQRLLPPGAATGEGRPAATIYPLETTAVFLSDSSVFPLRPEANLCSWESSVVSKNLFRAWGCPVSCLPEVASNLAVLPSVFWILPVMAGNCHCAQWARESGIS